VQPAQAAAPAPRQPVAPPRPPQPPQSLPPTTSQVLAARSHLQRSQGATTPKRVNRQPLPRAAGE
jgi:DNA polymerase-3 subunit gamma/tau